MKKSLLFPHRYKTIGWLVLIPALVVGLLALTTNDHLLGWHMEVFSIVGTGFTEAPRYFHTMTTEMTYTLSGSLIIIGALLIAFSKEKDEDEYVAQMRLSSFQWAVLVNYGLLLLAFLFVYGIDFLMVLPFNMFTMILLFIVRFQYVLYINRKFMNDEK